MWLAGLGGGLLAGPFLYWLDVPGRGRPVMDSQAAGTASSSYVDRDGWMLTVEDAAALAAKPMSQ